MYAPRTVYVDKFLLYIVLSTIACRAQLRKDQGADSVLCALWRLAVARAGCGVYGSYGVVCRHEPGGGARWGLERSPCRVSPFACGRVCGACPPRAPGPASQTHVTLATTNNAYIRYGIECTKTERIFDSSPFFNFYLLLFRLIYDKVILRLCVVLVGCGAGGRGGAPAAGARPRRARAEMESGIPRAR